MRYALVGATVLLTTAVVAHSQEPVPITGLNCEHASPPAESGLVFHMGEAHKVFPRRSLMGPGYTGCQIFWFQKPDGTYELGMLGFFERGMLVLFRNPLTGDCRYQNKSLIAGSEQDCPDPEHSGFPWSSVPVGCLEERRAISGLPPTLFVLCNQDD